MHMQNKNYYDEFVKEYKEIRKVETTKPKLLLHVCCAACSCYPLLFLNDLFDVTILYSNSNIYPSSEYDKRLESLKKYVNDFNIETKSHIDIIEDKYDYESFKIDLEKYKDAPEMGQRCKICIAKRMKRLYEVAKEKGFKYVTTVMTVSRNKDSNYINFLNEKISKQYEGITYIYTDFKKNEGQEIGIKIAKKFNVYRQNYCGCEYSLRNSKVNEENKYEVGVIVTSFDKVNHLEKCLDSLNFQDIKVPYLIYCLIDKNNEQDKLIAFKYQTLYKNKFKVKVVDTSISDSLNNAIKDLNAKYFSIVSSSDFVSSDFLSIPYKVITKSNSDLAIFNYYINKNDKFKKRFYLPKYLNSLSNKDIAKSLFKNILLKDTIFNKMYKKEFLINNNIFFLSFDKINEEFFFTFECLLFSNKTKFIKEPLYYYCNRKNKKDQSLVFDKQLNLINSFFLCKFIAFKVDKKDSVDTQFIFRRIIFNIQAILNRKYLDISLKSYLSQINKLFNKLSSDHYIYEGEEWEKALLLYNEKFKENLYNS